MIVVGGGGKSHQQTGTRKRQQNRHQVVEVMLDQGTSAWLSVPGQRKNQKSELRLIDSKSPEFASPPDMRDSPQPS